MEEKYTIIIKFNTKEEGLSYLNNSDIKFIFTDGIDIFDVNGNIINFNEPFTEIKINEIYLGNIKSGLNYMPGELFLENNLIKFIK
tara:strand:- start:263 stop:520 length:258 start_codon:yes stop_codon:yes gene_type:complete